MERRENEIQERCDAAQAAHEDDQAKSGQEEDENGDGSKEEFDVEAFKAAEIERFDEEYPPFEIPEEVLDDVDNDFNIEIEEEESAQNE